MRIFVIIFDSLRKDHTGRTYGNDWIKTPNFDNFAKDSIVFDNAYPESLPTIPVRRAIHTGIRTFPFNNDGLVPRTDDIVDTPGWTPIPSYQLHLAEYVKKWKLGYISSFITSTYHQFKPNMNFHLGFDQWNWIRGQEMDKLRARIENEKDNLVPIIEEHSVSSKNARLVKQVQKFQLGPYFRNVYARKDTNDYFPAQTFLKAAEFIKDTRNSSNILSVIDEFDPHEPWDPPKEFLDLYVDKNYSGNKVIHPPYSENLNSLTEEELKFMRASYAGEVSLCDHFFGYFIEELKNLEFYDESLIFLISDHGHSIGDHNATGKLPTFMYPELVDIPFMIKPPSGISGPKRIKKTYVYNHDILPTIFGFVKKEKPDIFDGIDLSIFLEEGDHLIENRNHITCGFNVCTLYKDDHYALITSNDRKKQKLFDLSRDPQWDENIAVNNLDISDELFKKIEEDAKGDLLLEYKIIDDLKHWYLDKGSKTPE